MGGSRQFVSFFISFISYVSGWLACSHWVVSFVLVDRGGVLFSSLCSPVLVFSDWAALGLKRATPRVECVFVLGQTE